MGIVDCGVSSVKQKVWSVKRRVWRVSVKGKVRSAVCRGWNVKRKA